MAVMEAGREVGRVCPGELAERGLTRIDLRDGWAPPIFDEAPELGELGRQPYRATYLALADERFAALPEGVEGERFLELFGIVPTFRVVRARLSDADRHACHDGIDDAPLAAYEATLGRWEVSRDEQRRDVRALRALEASLGEEARAAGVRSIAELPTDGDRGRRIERFQRVGARVAAIRAMQAHLRCEGLLGRADDGVLDGRTGDALVIFQRARLVVSPGAFDPASRQALADDSREADFRAVLRALRERVVAATGLLEDGSASQRWGTVLGRQLDPEAIRASSGRGPRRNGAADRISVATEAAARALGWTDADAFLSFFEQHRGVGAVAVRLPEAPRYHGEHMALRAEVDRGDVWYEYPYTAAGVARTLPVEQRPTLTLFATDEDGQEVALVTWPTTIGGWKPEQGPGGGVAMRYNESPVGPRLWRDVIAGPTWLPPASTPDEELVRREEGSVVPELGLFGPGHRSAYGLAMVVFHRPGAPLAEGRDGERVMLDEGVRAHGSVSYRSIGSGTSHGCHRLFNHLAVRLTGFLLAHRHHERRGPVATRYRRLVSEHGRRTAIRLDNRGVLYELTPPVEVNVLEGNILGDVHEAPDGLRALPERLAAAARAAAAAEE